MSEQPQGRELDAALAKALGYTVYHYDKDVAVRCYYQLWNGNDDVVKWMNYRESERKTEAEAWDDVPEFSTDLNSMHAVEEQIERMHFDEMYVEALDNETQYCGKWGIAHATAEQRARAALAVLTVKQ
jgi:hypothetical protein